MNIVPSRAKPDRGFSLVELAVYVMVLGIIATVIATVMVSLFRSEQTVSEVTLASNDSQIISTMLTNDIRNAREFVVAPTEVFASVAGRDATVSWQCVRWAVEGNTLIRQTAPDAGGALPVWGTKVTLGEDITSTSGDYFSQGRGSNSLQYNFGLKLAGDNVLPVQGQISNRITSDGTTCW